MSNVYKDYEPPVSEGLYHKFETGKTYTFRIASDPVCYISSYEAGGKTTDRMLYSWLVWNVTEEIAQVLKLPVTAYKQIAKYGADDEYGDPSNYNIRITRTGEGLKTIYEVIASPNKTDLMDIAPGAFDALEEIDLIEAVSKGVNVSNVHYLHEEVAGFKPSAQTVVSNEPFNDTPTAEELVPNAPSDSKDGDW